MKKLLKRIVKRKASPPETGGRITNETVAEHRERILAEGRKFKYPLQYTKRRVLVFTMIVVLGATLSLSGYIGVQLYGVQNYDSFSYRITQVLPLPVASVDGRWVRYSDYLSSLRSAVHYLTTKEAVNFNAESEKQQLDYQKRLAINKAIENALVAKLAADNKVNVSPEEIESFVKSQIASSKLGVSEDVYKQVIRDYYDWSFDEYKTSVGQQLLRKKVNAKLDSEARRKVSRMLQQITSGKDFAELAKQDSEDNATKSQGGDVGWISKSSEDPDGLLAATSKLQVNQVSPIIEGSDGLYIVKLLEKRDNGDVRFAKIFVAYKLIDTKLVSLRNSGKVSEYIKVPESATSTGR
jgi:hypothetical protein